MRMKIASATKNVGTGNRQSQADMQRSADRQTDTLTHTSVKQIDQHTKAFTPHHDAHRHQHPHPPLPLVQHPPQPLSLAPSSTPSQALSSNHLPARGRFALHCKIACQRWRPQAHHAHSCRRTAAPPPAPPLHPLASLAFKRSRRSACVSSLCSAAPLNSVSWLFSSPRSLSPALRQARSCALALPLVSSSGSGIGCGGVGGVGGGGYLLPCTA